MSRIWFGTMVVISAVVGAGCGRLGFEGSCALEPVAESFDADITAWNGDAREDRIETIIAYDAACAAELDEVARSVPPRSGTPGTITEMDLDWTGAQASFFLSAARSSEGPALAAHIERTVGGAAELVARDLEDRRSSDRRYHRLVVLSPVTHLAVVVDGREEDDD